MSSKKSGDNSNGQGRASNRLRAQEQVRRKRMWVRLLTFTALPLLVVVTAWFFISRPMGRRDSPVRLTVPAHSGILGIGSVLQRDSVVRSAYAFAITAKLGGKGGELKAGHYKFSGELTLEQVIERLTEGPNDLAADRQRVTIPEGYTVDQIGKLLSEKGVLGAGQFVQYVTDPASISALTSDFPLPHSSVEGYLFPDTYEFLPHSSPAQIANEMLLNFSKRFYRPYQQEIAAAPGGLPDIVSKASLIEREARAESDRPRIAGVIDNRLRMKMKLQIDAALLYGRAHKTRIMDGDLKQDSPYNTYLHPGLPAGPIACPGMGSLLAALHPENNDYIYYVARPTGYHIFTRTFAEHEAAVKKARAEWAAITTSGKAHTNE